MLGSRVLHPFRPVFALGETIGLAIGAGSLWLSWATPQRLVDIKPEVAKDNAFTVPVSVVWSSTASPSQPRIGHVLLVLAVAALVLAWIPVLGRTRTLRMVALLVGAGIPVALFARAARLHTVGSLGPGVYLAVAGFVVAAAFAGAISRLPLFLSLAPAILVVAALVGWFAGARAVA